ncbi:MAG: LPS export ABC transporter periplasmic protein LptC [Pseudomonadota bacterium]|nr:LPS export ABC transporter periplasmic protein LptC [Pseudomonadota bacterium]
MTPNSKRLLKRWRGRYLGIDQVRVQFENQKQVQTLKWLLPTGALLIFGIIILSWINPTTRSFRLDYTTTHVDFSGQDEMLRPQFLGVDDKKQRYTVTAEIAMRPERGHQQVFLMKPAADITLANGDWLTLKAEQGIYDGEAKTLELHGAVSMYVDNGFEMHTEKVEFDLSQGSAHGDEVVLSQSPWGILKANGFQYSPEGQIFHFSGRPVLVLHGTQKADMK